MLDLPDIGRLCKFCSGEEIAEIVEDEIESFNAKYPDARFSFAHIVLDDYNLLDGHIHWCLRQDSINEWFNYNLARCEPDACNPDSHNSWERWRYDELTELRDATIEMLRWLLTVPESMREMAFNE